MFQRTFAQAIFVFLVWGSSISQSAFADWMTLPGHYSHDPISGVRVNQYAPDPAPASGVVSNFRTSGYTHVRSSLQYGASADNYHRVEAWGDPVRPYGEWRFPFRPYSTPYPNWGPPYAGLGGFGFGFGGFVPPIGVPIGRPQPNADPLTEVPPRPNPFPGRGGVPFPNPAAGTNGFAPYPAGIGTPYPVAPYYDGFYPNYRQ